MTFAEKARIEHPERISIDLGRPSGCPHELGYSYGNNNTAPCVTENLSCDDCWNREVQAVSKSQTTKKSKAQLLEEINELKKQVSQLERYSKYEEAANEVRAMNMAFVSSGFTEDQAFDLTMKWMELALKQNKPMR